VPYLCAFVFRKVGHSLLRFFNASMTTISCAHTPTPNRIGFLGPMQNCGTGIPSRAHAIILS